MTERTSTNKVDADRTRVLICLHSFEPGGVERDILRLTPSLRAAGIDARIALGRREGVLQNEAPDVPYFDMNGLGTANYETLWMIRKLPGVIRQFRPHVLFCASNGLAAVAVAMRIVLGKKCPPIVMRISNDLVRADLTGVDLMLHRLGLKAQSRAYDMVVAMAEPLRAEIIEQIGVDDTRITVINNASLTTDNLQRFAQARDAADREHTGRRFVAVGRLMPQKNFGLLIDAFARIAGPEDRLTIVGEGALRQRLAEQAARLGVADRIDMPGHCFDAWNWFADADVFVLSSDFEGLPAVVVEALAAGIPIVATRCAASMPLLVEGAGRLVPIKDMAALATAMDNVLADEIDVAKMRARASAFTTEATVAAWAALFAKIARANGEG